MLELKIDRTTPIIEFSVTEISKKIKELLELNFSIVKIRGEISGIKIASSGHVYFNLKEKEAIIGCICWKRSVATLSVPLNEKSNGLEVSIIGKITSYDGQSKYQIIIEKIAPAGMGAMMQLLQQRKEKLAKEGLFDLNRKKSIPKIPNIIGVITSIEGAVIRDIIHRITARYPTHILIWPTTVQGNLAAEQITSGIAEFNKLPMQNRPDVLIIARGGGSIEDLWAFNEELVLRAVANSIIPIVSAIGHATDYTLIDEVADLFVPTPTAAAEIVTPNKTELESQLKNSYKSLTKALEQLVELNKNNLSYVCKTLQRINSLVEVYCQKIDTITFKLNESLPNLLKFKSTNLLHLNVSKGSLIKTMQCKNLQLLNSNQKLLDKIKYIITDRNNKLKLFTKLLNSLDYKNVLKRGFTIITDITGKLLTSAQQTDNLRRAPLNIRFTDGEVKVQKIE